VVVARSGLFGFVFSLGMAAGVLLWPGPARAQCGYGTPEFDCRQQQQQQQAARQNDENARRAQEEAAYNQPPPPQMRAIDSFSAAAWHKDSSDAWIAAGFLGPERARRAALNACNQVMGGGCAIAAENVNGTIVISRGVTGNLYASSGPGKGKTEKQARDYCQSQNDQCSMINIVWSKPGYAPVGSSVAENAKIYGPREHQRKLYGAVVGLNAAQVPAGSWHTGMWVASGFASADEARAKALADCKRDSPNGCEVVLALPDVYVAFASSPDRATYYSTGPSPEIAEGRVAAQCKKEKAKCRKGGWVNLAYSAQFRFDPHAEGMPWFTAQAWIKGDVDPWRNSVWSVSGAKDQEGAKRAVLDACRKESKVECEAASWSFNSRVALYIDETGYIRASWLNPEVDPATYVASKCAEQKVTCKLVRVVDSRVAKTERIEVK